MPVDPITAAIQAAPEMATMPGLIVPLVDVGGDTAGNAQAVAQGVNTQALSTAVQNQTAIQGGDPYSLQQAMAFQGTSANLNAPADPAAAPSPTAQPSAPKPKKSGGLFGDLESAVGDVAHVAKDIGGGALKALNYPLQQVQHNYRYLHDVEARHGPIAAALELAGIAAGATAGGFAAGQEGAVLGGELAGQIEGRVTYTDSWARTANGNAYRDPHSGQLVSPGRDFASLVGAPNKGLLHGVVSAPIDGAFDLLADPVAQGAGLVKDATSAEGAGGALHSVFSGTRPLQPSDVEDIYNTYPSVRRAFADIAGSSGGEIVARYGRTLGNLATPLAAASTPEEVADVFRQALEARNLSGALSLTGTLPTLSLTKLAFRGPAEWAAESVPGMSTALRKMQRLPDAFDPETLSFSNKEFSPGDDFGARGIYQTLLMGEKPDVAKAVLDEYLSTSDPGQRIQIYRNAVGQMLMARAKMGDEALSDPEVMRNLNARLDDLTGGSAPGKTAFYGVGADGHDLSKVPMPDGQTTSAAITDNQVGKLAFPNYSAIKQTARELAGANTLFGTLDQFAYDHFTQGFFKKLVLLSGSFAAHITAAEMIPNTLRLGFRNMVSSAVETQAARLGIRASEDDLGPITGALYKLLGSPSSLEDVNPDDLSVATKLALRHGAGGLAPGITADAALSKDVGIPGEEASRNLRNAALQTPPKMRPGDDFGLFGTGDAQRGYHWAGWLREIAGDEKSQIGAGTYRQAIADGATESQATAQGARSITQWLDAQPEDHLRNYVRHTVSSTEDLSPHEDWGRVAMENIKGATTGADGTVHVPLLDKIANGESITPHDVADIEPSAQPTLVKGRQFLPDSTGTIDRIANFGHQRVLGPIINFLSREPIYLAQVKAEYEPLQGLVESGVLTDSDAMDLAESRAVNKMSKFVHNVQERSQFSETMRNFAPFYFAQEQSYKRFGRLLAEDPRAFRQMQMITSSMANVSSQATDKAGNNWAIYPGTGFITGATMGVLNKLGIPTTAALPMAFNGSVSSLNTIFPFAEGVRPSVGPLVSIPAHLLENFDPHLAPAVSAAIGSMAAGGPIWEQVVPNTFVQRIMTGFAGQDSRAFQSAMMQQIQSLAFEQNKAMDAWNAGGQKGPKPQLVPDANAGPAAQQVFVNKVRNQTRILYIMKAVLGEVTPASPGFSIGDLKLPAELQADISANGLSAGLNAFLAKNPDATPYTVFQSDAPSGAHLDATAAAMDWVNQNEGFINKYPGAAAYLIPPDPNGKYNPAIYNEQIALGLRQKKTPETFLNDLYIASGNQQYFSNDLPQHKAALAAAKGDSQATAAENANWTAYLQQYGLQNPIWYADYSSKDKLIRAQQAIAQLQAAFKAGDVPPGQQSDDVAGLLQDWQTYQDSLTVGRVDGYAAGTKTATRDNFDNYLAGLAQEKPNLAGLINNVFRKAA